MYEHLLNLAKIRLNGSILLGHHVLCDGDATIDLPQRKIACYSHIHDDHLGGWPYCLSQFDAIITTKQTKDLLVQLTGPYIPIKTNVIGIEYGHKFKDSKLSGETVTLFNSGHILGSSQILVETEKGERVLYSSDFNLNGAEIPEDIDVLVLDSTHGDPQYKQNSNRIELINEIIRKVKEEIQELKPVIIRAHRGKLQYLMSLLREEIRSNIDFVSKEDDRKLSEVYKQYGFNCGNILSDESEEFQKILRRNEPYIRFSPFSENIPCEREGVRSIRVGQPPDYEITETNMFQINLSDHSSFDEIMQYISLINPKLVITDNSKRFNKTSIGITLANIIKRDLTREAVPSPEFDREKTYELR